MKHALQNSKIAGVLAILLVIALLFGMGATVMDDDENLENEGSAAAEETSGGETGDNFVDGLFSVSAEATETAGDATTLKTLLEDTTTEVINITTTASITVTDAIELKMNKTITSSTNYSVRIDGSISGGHTITTSESGNLHIGGTFDCSFTVISGYLYIENSSAALGAGKTIILGRNGEADGGSVVFGSSASFTNSGTIICHSGSVQILGGATFTNSGTVTLNGSGGLYIRKGATLTNGGIITMSPVVIDGGEHAFMIYVEGAFNDSGGTVTSDEGTIDVSSNGIFQRPTTLNNAEGFICGDSTSNFGSGFSFLTFDGNGGEVSRERTTIVIAEQSGIVFDLTKVDGRLWPERAGYVFIGWFTAATGGTKIDMDNTAYQGAGQTLYAQWGTGTTAAELIAFLESSTPGEIALKNFPEAWYDIEINQSITLGGNKTINVEDNDGWSIYINILGGLSGDYTLTVRGGAIVGIRDDINSNIVLNGGSFNTIPVGDSHTSKLVAGKSITMIGDDYWALVSVGGGTFENEGTIDTGGRGSIWVGNGGIFRNSGTVNTGSVVSTFEGVTWITYGAIDIERTGKFINNAGTVNNKGLISVYGSGQFEMPTNFVNDGAMYGEKTSNFVGAFDFLTLNANGGHFDWSWDASPTVTAVVAVPSGRAFNMTSINDMVYPYRDSGNESEWYYLTGWFTAATGGTLVDGSNASQFAKAGSTLFAQWELVGEAVIEPWSPTPEKIEEEIAKAVEKGVGVVVIDDFSDVPGVIGVDLSIAALTAIADASLALTVHLSDGRILSLDAKALASLVEKAEGEDVTLTINKQGQSAIARLPDAQKAEIGANDAVFNITLEAGGESITQFDGLITITLPWNGGFPARVYYLHGDGKLDGMTTTYNETAKLVTFTTNHLSIYLIRYAPSSDNTRAGPPQTGVPSNIILWATLLLASAIGGTATVIALVRRGKAARQ